MGSGMIRIAHVASLDLTHRFLLLPQLTRLRDEGYEVTAVSAPGPHVSALEAEGIRHLPLRHVTRAWDPIEDARFAGELYRPVPARSASISSTRTIPSRA